MNEEEEETRNTERQQQETAETEIENMEKRLAKEKWIQHWNNIAKAPKPRAKKTKTSSFPSLAMW